MGIPFASLILSLSSSTKTTLISIFTGLICLMSFVTFSLYVLDKKRRKEGKKPICKPLLLLFPWCFGGIGGFIGVYGLRQYMRYWYFPLNNVLAMIIQIAILLTFIIL